MDETITIRAPRPWMAYPGSTVQQNYAEDVRHGFLLWEIDNKDSWDVRFCELPNPRPFVTVEWEGSVEATLAAARRHPPGARFRVRNRDVLTQKDVAQLTSVLRNELKAMEVTFKSEHQVNRDVVSTGATTLAKDDLRNPEVLMRLLREYHKEASVTEEEWAAINVHVCAYLRQAIDGDSVVRNARWTPRHLKFDNTFNYGSGNVISFERMQGVVGIFGPNRSGKSSIIGSLLYALFNTTDRGNLKNMHVVNVRHPLCYAKAIINVNATNYVIERQTAKYETRKGQVYAGTALNVFRISEDGTAVDLVGEQRNDTEKVIKHLIGTSEDCLMTSVAAQDDVKQFINQGTTKRRKDVSRFLDLDIFDKMYELAKLDVNANKGALKQLPDRDWKALEDGYVASLTDKQVRIQECDDMLHDASLRLQDVQQQLVAFKGFNPVTQTQVDQHRSWVSSLEASESRARAEHASLVAQVAERAKKIAKIDDVLGEHDIGSMKKRLDVLRSLEASLDSLRLVHEKDVHVLKQQERSLKILDEVPCGDAFPTCKFIKDAFKQKDKVPAQRDRVQRSLERVKKAQGSIDEMKADDLQEKVSKLERLTTLRSTLANELVRLESQRDKKEHELQTAASRHEQERRRLEELEEALKNEENAEAVALRNKLDSLQKSVKSLTSDRLALASEVGKIQSDRARADVDMSKRQELLQLMRAHELIAHGFSRKGIPSLIVASQLPIINAEVAKILSGIVDFSIELEQDDDSDSLEIYIDYGDSRRIIELASGMEKTIASIAIRVALINVTSLPKTDIFIIDEAFGPLDPAGVEACNRLLTSLKRCFRAIVVITHVEGVKDVADHIIEVSRVEKDARVVYDESCHNDRTLREG